MYSSFSLISPTVNIPSKTPLATDEMIPPFTSVALTLAYCRFESKHCRLPLTKLFFYVWWRLNIARIYFKGISIVCVDLPQIVIYIYP